MQDINNILEAWKRCRKCTMGLIPGSAEGTQAYLDCEYTLGMHCRKDLLEFHTIELLEQLKNKCPNECECWDAAYERGKLDAKEEVENLRLEIAHEALVNSIFTYQGKELIRCKDCLHGCDWEDGRWKCIINGGMHEPEWFCADGVRRK